MTKRLPLASACCNAEVLDPPATLFGKPIKAYLCKACWDFCSLVELPGFKPLKFGRIHLRCPECGRKVNNQKRAEHDPPKAVLWENGCDRCCWDYDDVHYFDASGTELLDDPANP